MLIRIISSHTWDSVPLEYLENGLLPKSRQCLRITLCLCGYLDFSVVGRLLHAIAIAIDGVKLHGIMAHHERRITMRQFAR